MKSLMIIGVVLAVAIAGILALSRYLHLSQTLTIALVTGAAVVAVIVYLVGLVLSLKRATAIEQGVAGAAAAPGESAAMRDQFTRYLQALKQSPSGKSALATLPWYLVIGSPGSGKTTMLQESGLAFSSLGHGLRAIRGIGGTRNCDWWFTDSAIFLDTAGRYTTQPEDQGEWFEFLDLVKRNRSGHPLNGILLVVSLPDLVKDHEAAIAATVRPMRERIIEVCDRLKVVLPVYLVFTKADMVGGFKDFFATLPRNERDQVWGTTLGPGEMAGATAEAVYEHHVQKLAAGLQARRMSALAGGDRAPAALAKAMMFPSNFLSSQRWMGSLVAELFRPFPLSDQPVFRGFYITSSIQPAKDTGKTLAAVVPAQAPAAPVPPPIENIEASIFFMPTPGQKPQVDQGDGKRGFFLRDLFAKVVIGDARLAGSPAAVRRRTAIGRAALAYGSILIALALSLHLISGTGGDGALVVRTAEACRTLRAAQGDERTLEALDALRERLVEVRDHAADRTAILREAHRSYFPVLLKMILQPGAERLRSDIASILPTLATTTGSQDRLFELMVVYQFLSGELRIDPERDHRLMLRTLVDEPRLAERLVKKGEQPDERLKQQLADHVEYLVSVMPRSDGWQIRGDTALIERTRAALGDNAWVPLAFAELMTAAGSGRGRIDRDQVIDGEDRELLTLSVQISEIYTHDAYDTMIEPAIAEKAAALEEKLAQMKTRKLSRNELARRLRTQFAREHLNRWLDLIAGVRPANFATMAEANDRLRILVGPDSPYRSLPRQLAAQRIDFSDIESVPPLPADPGWMEDGLEAAKDLQAAVERFVAATETGNRARDPRKLVELAEACNLVADKFAAIAARLDHEPVRRAVGQCLRNLIDGVHAALAAELSGEIERGWSEQVEKAFREQCQGRFPFDPDAKAEVPLDVFARLFNPKTGTFVAVLQQVEALRAMKLAGRDLLPVSYDYQRALAATQLMKEVFFIDGGTQMSMSFSLVLIQREAVQDLFFSVGDSKFSFYDRPDHKGTLAWNSSVAGGAKLSISLDRDEWLTREELSPGWGILRLLRSGEPRKRPEGGHRLSWTFESQGRGRSYQAEAILEAPALETLVSGDLFKNFTIPTRIGRDPRERK